MIAIVRSRSASLLCSTRLVTARIRARAAVPISAGSCCHHGLERCSQGAAWPPDALGQCDLVQQFGVLAAEALEVLRALERQAAADVALDDLITSDEVAIHGWRCCCGLRCGRLVGVHPKGASGRGLHPCMVPRGLRQAPVPAHSSSAQRVKIANCVTVSILTLTCLALCCGLERLAGLW